MEVLLFPILALVFVCIVAKYSQLDRSKSSKDNPTPPITHPKVNNVPPPSPVIRSEPKPKSKPKPKSTLEPKPEPKPTLEPEPEPKPSQKYQDFDHWEECPQFYDGKDLDFFDLNTLFDEPIKCSHHEVIRNSDICSWEKLYGVPLYFFYYYMPQRYKNVSKTSQYARSVIYRFKDGIDCHDVVNMLKSKLYSSFGEYTKELTFVCIPASSRRVTVLRCCNFSRIICDALGMENGYDHIHITKEKTPKHLGGNNKAEYQLDESFFYGKNIVLFDDVVTKGNTMRAFVRFLEDAGAHVICQISIGKTYNEYYVGEQFVHPWNGEIDE